MSIFSQYSTSGNIERKTSMDNQKLGIFITELRKEKGLTQAQLAQKLNVTDKAVSKWERGVGFPDIKLLEPLADVLDISLLDQSVCQKQPFPLQIPQMHFKT